GLCSSRVLDDNMPEVVVTSSCLGFCINAMLEVTSMVGGSHGLSALAGDQMLHVRVGTSTSPLADDDAEFCVVQRAIPACGLDSEHAARALHGVGLEPGFLEVSLGTCSKQLDSASLQDLHD